LQVKLAKLELISIYKLRERECKGSYLTISIPLSAKWARLNKFRQSGLAHLIVEEGEKPMDIYWKVGFKNLSNFSTAFKREFGVLQQ
jgi:AraC-like DNA-binding protein